MDGRMSDFAVLMLMVELHRVFGMHGPIVFVEGGRMVRHGLVQIHARIHYIRIGQTVRYGLGMYKT